MSEINLSKTETNLLVAAAERGGVFEFPDATKPSTRERVLGRLLRDKLITTGEVGHLLTTGEVGHLLTTAGYRAVGLKVPRAKRAAAGSGEGSTQEPRVSKSGLILELLGRGEGASLVELTDATGWLPHTARAALSRLRSAGKPLAKGKREDGTTCYRLVPDEPKPARKPRAERQAEASA